MKRQLHMAAAMLLTVGLLSGCSARSAQPKQEPKVFSVVLESYSITPKRFQVQAGQPVRFVVVNQGDQEHEFEFESLDLETPRLPPGKTAVLDVVFPKAGTYEAICDILDHHQRGMSAWVEVSE